MRRTVLCSLLLFVCSSLLAIAAENDAEQKLPDTLGRQIEPFTLNDFHGKEWSLADFSEAKVLVVAFMGTECPLVKLYGPRLNEFQREYAGSGVQVIGINSNQQDSLEEMAHFARTKKIEFPVLKDPGNVVADRFKAERTPGIFVLDADRKVRYHGRVDDQYTYGIQKPKVTHEYLREAIDALLAGEEVAIKQTEVVGCHIGRKLKADETSPVTYSNQIARILQKRCVECHRDGELAPFAMHDYDEVVGWAEMIAEVVYEQRMPPWHADPKHGDFLNDARLTDEEKKLIYDWVEAGAPEGDPADLPPPREFTPGWRIGEPDQIVYMPKTYDVPATGEVKYQYFVVDPGFQEDKWIQAAECRPGNREVVHHIIVAVVGDRARRRVHGDIDSEWLAATAPGSRPMQLPEGYAKYVPAGSKLVFQMHYTPNGTATTDKSCVGLKFADPKTVKQEVYTRDIATQRFVIPPGADNHKVEADMTFRRDATMLAMFPHMHLRGKSFRYEAIYPDGKREILLDVPNYDFNWQNAYILAEPKQFPKGTRIHCTAHFDNSEENLSNPDPTAAVRWGDQTWEEMMIGYFDMVITDQDLTNKSSTSPRTEQFLLNSARSQVRVDDDLRALAAAGAESEDKLTELLLALRKMAPQLDRICITAVADGGKIRIARVAQETRLAKTVGGSGATLSANNWSLPTYAKGDKTVVNENIAAVGSAEFRFMSTALGASMHVPITFEGQPATINFWSAENGAFPEEAVELLEEIAKAAGHGNDQ